MPRLLDKYKEDVAPALKDKFNYKSPMQDTKAEKICCYKNVGVW